jgi:hypothetical protein
MSSVQLGNTGRYLVWSDDHKIMTELNRPILSEAEVNDIVAFLESLSSDSILERIKLAHQMEETAIAAK